MGCIWPGKFSPEMESWNLCKWHACIWPSDKWGKILNGGMQYHMKEKFPDWVQQDADYFLCLNLQSFILKSPLPPSINSAEEQRNLQEHIQSFGEYHKYDTRIIQIIHSFGACILTYGKAAAVDKYVATNIVWPYSKVILGKCYLFWQGYEV